MSERLHTITERLSDQLQSIEPPESVTNVYRPLRYARDLHRGYLETFGAQRPREVLLVGMNPGPWGMGQTGVPFGDVDVVGDWMGLQADVEEPDDPHPKRPVDGLACERNEVSGSRLWGWAEERFGSAEAFFERFFVHNYCPLLFLEESGRNRPPSRMRVAEQEAFTPACDDALREMVDYFEPNFVIGVGNYARDQIESALEDHEFEFDFTTGRILHPSPASPKANQGWVEQAEEQLEELGVQLPD